MRRIGFLLLGWGYFVVFGVLSVVFSFRPFFDFSFLMSVYAARGPFGPLEVLVLSAVSDLLSTKALGSGILANILVFSFSRQAFRAFEPFWRVTLLVVFSSTFLGHLVEGLLDPLLRGERPLFSDWGFTVALGNTFFSYGVFKFNDVLLKREKVSSE